MPHFKERRSSRGQVMLFPPSLDELVPLESEVRLLDEAMESMDWSGLESSYSEIGRPAYHPKIVAKALVYAYSKGIRSSRRIAELVTNDVRVMWLCEGEKPDYHTIARFRKERFGELGELFVESVHLCARAGLVLLRNVSADGSKLHADVSRSSLYDEERIAKERDEVDRILREAEAVDAEEARLYGDWDGCELPEQMKDPELRRQKLAELAEELREQKRKMISATDPECRMMMSNEGLQPAYNVQTVVDSEDQIIVATSVTNAETDHGQLPELLDQVEENTGLSPGVVLADSGYSSESTLIDLGKRGQEALIPACGEHKKQAATNRFASENFELDRERDVLTCPAGRELVFRDEHRKGGGTYRRYSAIGCRSCRFHAECVPLGRASRCVSRSVISELRRDMRQKLNTPEGKALFASRKATVEPVFGRIKQNWGMRRFVLRGLNGAAAEVYLAATAHNLMKWVAAQAAYAFLRISGSSRTTWAHCSTQ
jgi:transposase